MDKYFKSEKNTENSFHRLIQPVNVYTNLRRTSLTPYANENIHYDGTISIFKLIGLRPILVAMARQSVQLVSEEVIETRNFFKESYARALPYKHIFFEWVTRVFLNLRRIVFSYSINHKNADQVQIYDTAIENSYHDNNEQDSENYDDRFDDFDSHSVFSNADTDISSPQQGNNSDPAKVAALENEVLILKQQFSFILQQMNINIPQAALLPLPLTSSLPAPIVGGPIPPPPLPDFLKPSEIIIKRSKKSAPENDTNPQTVPRITEILGDLSKVQLRHVPRSPGGTPCRNNPPSSGNELADAVKDAMDKRRKDFDVSFDGSTLNDSWEDDKEN